MQLRSGFGVESTLTTGDVRIDFPAHIVFRTILKNTHMVTDLAEQSASGSNWSAGQTVQSKMVSDANL